ncbi:MAG: Fur family transcriptional regulator [Paracoccaceae bacterium]
MTRTDPASPLRDPAFRAHDHADCIDRRRAALAERGLRLTPARACALDALWSAHRAMGAYEVLEALRDAGLGTAPVAAYRALDWLAARGLAHRIERLNAWIACDHADGEHAPAFLICRGCDAVAEARVPDQGALGDAARAAGFAIEATVREATGLCAACAAAETPTAAAPA